MSIPLDRLYHFINNIANEIRKDTIIIYRFFPHGSRNLLDLSHITSNTKFEIGANPWIVCYDQEPLNYQLYDLDVSEDIRRDPGVFKLLNNHKVDYPKYNIKPIEFNIFDYCILLHSEKLSPQVELYQQLKFIPAYYWSHGIIARDWFRYAQHITVSKNIKKTFLIYNRAWSGTREYRLKFLDLIIEHKLNSECQTSFNPVDPELNASYQEHIFLNNNFKPTYNLEKYFLPTLAASTSSADFEISDYASTEFEVVLETLFDDDRIQLTEKILRPIACGQPFLLVSTVGSLEYLKEYGFKTFNGIIDESYDKIKDPLNRMTAIVQEMAKIKSWTAIEREEKFKEINEIVFYNKQHFFSKKFESQLITELTENLTTAITEVENKNTSEDFFNRYNKTTQIPELKKLNKQLLGENTIQDLINRAKYYQNKNS